MITTFGEIMLRLMPADSGEKIADATDFEVRPGGSESNVAIALANLGMETCFATCLPHNQLGHKILRHLKAEGVNTDFIRTKEGRLGTYWTETGLGPRNSFVIYDRENSVLSNITPEDIDWEHLLSLTSWFHFSGISPAISENVYQVLSKLPDILNCPYSVDLNFRSKLWEWVNKDPKLIRMMMTELCRNATFIAGNESDFQNVFGFQSSSENPETVFSHLSEQCFKTFPNLEYVAISNRESLTASLNNWSGFLFNRKNPSEGYQGIQYRLDNIRDRVGTGDSFSAGIIYGLQHRDTMTDQDIIDFAVTLGALNHTTIGDASHFTAEDVLNTMKTGGSGRIIR
jgi:2-dehydro-3-deoxygluconokinase